MRITSLYNRIEAAVAVTLRDVQRRRAMRLRMVGAGEEAYDEWTLQPIRPVAVVATTALASPRRSLPSAKPRPARARGPLVVTGDRNDRLDDVRALRGGD